MARTLEQIQEGIINQLGQNPTLASSLTSTSKVAIWRLWVYIISFSIWLLEQLWDVFKIEIDDTIARQKLGSLRWYKDRALEYQHGYPLIDDGVYDNTNITEEQIQQSNIVKHAAIEERGRFLHVKVATETNNDLAPLNATQKEAFRVYLNHIKFAGTRIKVISLPADDLRIYLDVYYNPLVLNQLGQRLDGTHLTPVQDGVNTYLKELEFNGALILTKLVDYLQQIEGVQMPVIRSAFSRYGGFNWQRINEVYFSEAGYMRLESDLIINNAFRNVAREDRSYINFISFYERT